MNVPKISVIVPVYNVEKYLCKCIDSILCQTFADFEVLLIDDGSSDRSGIICNEYSLKDSRVRVFHQENKGVCAARNLGLEMKIAPWFTFIDSDDYVSPNYLSNLISMATNGSEIDLIQSSHIVKDSCIEMPQRCVNNRIITNDMGVILKKIRGLCCCKLFKTSIERTFQIRFDIGISIAEDLCFVLNYLKHVSLVCFTEDIDYYYVIREGSATKINHKPEVLYKQFHLEFELITELNNIYQISEQTMSYRKALLAKSLMNYISSLYLDKTQIKKHESIKAIPSLELSVLAYFHSKILLKNIIASLLFNHCWKYAFILLDIMYMIKQIIK